MSNREDRIVRMGFENEKFESGARQSMSTLDKLNEKLKLKGASQGASDVQKSFDRVDFSKMEQGIASLERRFSAMGIASMNVINKITDGITRSVAKIEQATIGQIKTGGWSRAMNIANAKFQIEGLGFQWDQIEQAVSYGVKDTAYGLDAAATAASQLAASGVDFSKTLETVNGQDLTAMHKSLRAISGVAAMTNSSYEDISRIFTTVAGNGRLMGDQLLQLSSRGMNAAAKLAEVMHTTESEIRDMVSKGKIDFQTFAFAMDDAFGQHAKEANKTFTGALGNTKAALSRIGEIFASPVINNTNTLFISLTKRIDEFKNKLKSITVPRSLDEIKKKYKDISNNAAGYDAILKSLGDRTVKFGDDFAAMWKSGIDAFSALVESIDISWFDTIVAKVDDVTVKIKDFFDMMKELATESSEEMANGVQDATKTLLVSAEEAQAAKDILQKGMYGTGAARQKALQELFGGGEEGKQHAKNVQAYIDSIVKANWSYEKANIKVAESNKDVVKTQEDIERENKKAKLKIVIDTTKQALSNLWKVVKNIGKAAGKILGAIGKGFKEAFNLKIDYKSVSSGIIGITEWLVKLSEKVQVSESTLSSITKVSSTFFGVVRKGLGFVKDGAKYLRDLFLYVTGQKTELQLLKEEYGDLPGYALDAILDSKGSKFEIFRVIKEKVSDFIEFFKSIPGSSVIIKVKEIVSNTLDDVQNLGSKLIGRDNSVVGVLKAVIDGIKDILSSDTVSSIPDKLKKVVNNILDAIKMVRIADVLKIAVLYKLVFGLAYFVSALRKVGTLLVGIAWIPDSIAMFFDRLARSTTKIGYAAVFLSLAHAITEVATVMTKIAEVDEQGLYRAIGVIVVIALVFKFLLNFMTSMSVKKKILRDSTSTMKGTVADLAGTFGLVRTIVAIGGLLWALGKAVSIVGAALASVQATAKDTESANSATFSHFLTLIGALGAFATAFITYAAKTPTIHNFSFSITINAIGAMIIEIASAFAIMAGALVSLSRIKPESLDTAVVILITVFGGIFGMLTQVEKFAFIPIGNILAMGFGVSRMIGTIGTTMVSIASAINEASKGIATLANAGDNVESMMMVAMSVIGSILLSTIIITEVGRRNADNALMFSIAMSGIAFAINALGNAMSLAASGISTIASLPMENAGVGIAGMIIIFSGIIGVIAIASQVDAKKLSAVTLTLIGISVAMVAAAKAISMLSGSENVWQSAMAIFALIASVTAVVALIGEKTSGNDAAMKSLTSAMLKIAASIIIVAIALKIVSSAQNLADSALALEGVIISIGIVLAVMSAVGSKYGQTSQDGAKAIGTAFLMISASMLIIALALEKLGNVQNLIASAAALGIAILAISAALAIVAMAGGKSSAGADSMMALGSAFIMIAGAMYILALAIKEIANIPEEGLTQSAIVFGAFAVALGLIAVLAALFPGIGKAMMTVGKAFLYAGAGAALIGAGIYLLSAGLAKLAPWLPILRMETTMFLEVLEEHWPVALAVALTTIAVLGLLVLGISKLSPVLQAIGQVIVSVAKVFESVITAITSKAKNFVSGLTTRGKAVINALVVALCGGIMSASPQLLNTIGQLIIKLLAFLGSIAGDIALGLLDFLINLIYGLADAIMINSSRILAALRNVMRALGDLLIQALADLVAALDFLDLGWGDKLREHAKGVSEEIFKLAQDDKAAAEISSQAKREYLESIKGEVEETKKAMEESGAATEESTNLLTALFDKTASASKASTDSQISDIERLKQEYGTELPGYAYDAILRSKEAQEKAGQENGIAAAKATTDAYSSEMMNFDFSNMDMESMDINNLMEQTGMSSDELKQYGFDMGTDIKTGETEALEDPEMYEEAQKTNINEGTIKAIEDGKPRVESAVQEYINEPAEKTIRGYWSKYYEASSYCIDGACRAFEWDSRYKNTVGSWSEEGVEEMRRVLRISSPSKVFYQNGEYIIAGLVNGLDQNTKEATNSMGNLSEAIIAAFGNPIAYCSKIASGEISYSPRIRPVVDSSSLVGGVRSVSTMFDQQSISLNGMSGKLAADIGTLDRSNADAIEELRGLRSDMAVMADQIANMQLVMDTGALVGSISGPIDRALGRRTVLKGRRN